MNLIVLAAAVLIVSSATQSPRHHSGTHVSAAIQYSTYDRYGNEVFVSLRSGDPYYGYDDFYYDDYYYRRCEPVYVVHPVYLFHDPYFVVDRPVHVVRRPVFVREPVYVRRPVYVREREDFRVRSYAPERREWRSQPRREDARVRTSGRIEARWDGGGKSHGDKGGKERHGKGHH